MSEAESPKYRLASALAIVPLTVMLTSLACQVRAGTGAVPLTGSLSANQQRAGAQDTGVWLYLNVTALQPAEQLMLEVVLPQGVSVHGGTSTRRRFENLAAEQTVSIALRVHLTDNREATVHATATLVDDEHLTLRKGFVFSFNPARKPEAKTKELLDSDGEPLIVYPSGR